MKRWLTVLVLCMAVVLAGCGGSGAGQNFGEMVDTWRPSKNGTPRSQTPAEITNYPAPDFGEELGFDVTGYPDTAELSPRGFFVIDGWFGQLDYNTEDERVLVVRVAAGDQRNVAQSFSESHVASDEARTIDGVEVRVRTSSKECTLVTWERGDYQYALHSAKGQAPPSDEEIKTMVKGLDSAAAG